MTISKPEAINQDMNPKTGFSVRSLEDFVSKDKSTLLKVENPYRELPLSEIQNKLLNKFKWRSHHGLGFMKERANLYSAYSNRVDAMISAIQLYLKQRDIEIADYSVCDLAAAEGFVANSFLERGLKNIDLYELSDDCIDRIHLIQAYKNLRSKVFKVDLEYVDWASLIDKKYHLVFCLGIVYHLENPVLFLRNLFQVTNKYAVIESDTPLITHGFRGNGGYFMNRDQLTLSADNVRPLLEMRPNRKALIDTLHFIGFKKIHIVQQSNDVQCKYFESGEKTMLFCEK